MVEGTSSMSASGEPASRMAASMAASHASVASATKTQKSVREVPCAAQSAQGMGCSDNSTTLGLPTTWQTQRSGVREQVT
jgi:murein endopeptidase